MKNISSDIHANIVEIMEATIATATLPRVLDFGNEPVHEIEYQQHGITLSNSFDIICSRECICVRIYVCMYVCIYIYIYHFVRMRLAAR